MGETAFTLVEHPKTTSNIQTMKSEPATAFFQPTAADQIFPGLSTFQPAESM